MKDPILEIVDFFEDEILFRLELFFIGITFSVIALVHPVLALKYTEWISKD